MASREETPIRSISRVGSEEMSSQESPKEDKDEKENQVEEESEESANPLETSKPADVSPTKEESLDGLHKDHVTSWTTTTTTTTTSRTVDNLSGQLASLNIQDSNSVNMPESKSARFNNQKIRRETMLRTYAKSANLDIRSRRRLYTAKATNIIPGILAHHLLGSQIKHSRTMTSRIEKPFTVKSCGIWNLRKCLAITKLPDKSLKASKVALLQERSGIDTNPDCSLEDNSWKDDDVNASSVHQDMDIQPILENPNWLVSRPVNDDPSCSAYDKILRWDPWAGLMPARSHSDSEAIDKGNRTQGDTESIDQQHKPTRTQSDSEAMDTHSLPAVTLDPALPEERTLLQQGGDAELRGSRSEKHVQWSQDVEVIYFAGDSDGGDVIGKEIEPMAEEADQQSRAKLFMREYTRKLFARTRQYSLIDPWFPIL